MLDNVGEARLSCSVCSVRAVCTPAQQRACVRGPKTVSGWRAPSPGYQTQLLSWCRTLGESAGTAWYASNIFMQLWKIIYLHAIPAQVLFLYFLLSSCHGQEYPAKVGVWTVWCLVQISMNDNFEYLPRLIRLP